MIAIPYFHPESYVVSLTGRILNVGLYALHLKIACAFAKHNDMGMKCCKRSEPHTESIHTRQLRKVAPGLRSGSDMASVKRYPRAILNTPGTSGYYISYNRVLRAVLQKPLRWGIFYRFQLQHRRACCCSWQRPRAACACLIGEVHITTQSFCCCCCCC